MRSSESLRGRHWLVCLVLGLTVLPTALAAQFLGKPQTPSVQSDEVSIGSPRASLQNYLRLADAADWEGASAYLSVPRAEQDRAEQLARRLKSVLDQRAGVECQCSFAQCNGRYDDGDLTGRSHWRDR